MLCSECDRSATDEWIPAAVDESVAIQGVLNAAVERSFANASRYSCKDVQTARFSSKVQRVPNTAPPSFWVARAVTKQLLQENGTVSCATRAHSMCFARRVMVLPPTSGRLTPEVIHVHLKERECIG